jgi:GTP cyclohydrolase I
MTSPIDRSVASTYAAELLRVLGMDLLDPSTRDTPARMVKALEELTAGARCDPKALLQVEFNAGEYDEVVVVRDITFTALCEHHVLPFRGRASVAYLPSAAPAGGYRVIGLSKIPRLVRAYASRFQLQERLTAQIATALRDSPLAPRGVAVRVTAEHECMSCRGVRAEGASMVTQFLTGAFMDDRDARAEVLQLLHV